MRVVDPRWLLNAPPAPSKPASRHAMFQKHKTETSAVTLSKVGEGSAGELAQGLSHKKTDVLLPGLSLGFWYG